MTYDEWKTTEPEREERCPECDGERDITIEEVIAGELIHTIVPCPRCGDVDDRDSSELERRLPDSDHTGLPESPR